MVDFDFLFSRFKEYVSVHGDACVPVNYVCEDGYRLGYEMRKLRRYNARLTAEQRKLLTENGFIWRMNGYYKNFNVIYPLIVSYKEEFGECWIPSGYVTKSGINLGEIVRCIRKGKIKISDEQKAALDDIDFVWVRDRKRYQFEEICKCFEEYKKVYGNLRIPYRYQTSNGMNLGSIAYSIRNGTRAVTERQREVLTEMGFPWEVNTYEMKFERFFTHFTQYVEKYGDGLVPMRHVCEDGFRLGIMVGNLRMGNYRISNEQRERLINAGFVFKVRKKKRTFDEIFEMIKEYAAEHDGSCSIPTNYVTKDGERLGAKAACIRYGRIKVSDEQRKMLDGIGFSWEVRR